LDYLTTYTSISPIRRRLAPGFVNYKKGALNSTDKAYQLLVHGRWFSPGTPASFTTKTGRHDIAEILLKVALNSKIQTQTNDKNKIQFTERLK
jgi:tRNA U34 5-methylaminomethyl-2-thiouridine-forming methyltransferase MnmC